MPQMTMLQAINDEFGIRHTLSVRIQADETVTKVLNLE